MVTTIATLLHSQSKSRNQWYLVCRDTINCKDTIVLCNANGALVSVYWLQVRKNLSCMVLGLHAISVFGKV